MSSDNAPTVGLLATGLSVQAAAKATIDTAVTNCVRFLLDLGIKSSLSPVSAGRLVAEKCFWEPPT
jgi:hypothetical protein